MCFLDVYFSDQIWSFEVPLVNLIKKKKLWLKFVILFDLFLCVFSWLSEKL